MNAPDPTLLNIFAAEQSEHVAHMRALLSELPGADAERRNALLERIMRRAHTLKGAARAVGLDATEQVVHRIESVVVRHSGEWRTPGDDATDVLQRALDVIEDVLAWAQGRRVEPEHASIIRELDRLGASIPLPQAEALPQSPAPELPVPSPGAGDLVRVPAATLDAVIRIAAEMVTAASHHSALVEQLVEHNREIDEADRDYLHLRRACAAFLRRQPPTAAVSAVSEYLRFVDSKWNAFGIRARRDAAAQQQSSWLLRRQVDELRRFASQARMVPAETVFGSFGAMIRALGAEEGKQIVFRAEGLELAADRVVLQSLKDPVMHMLRNAVSHGIETPAVRRAAGKPEAGLVQLLVRSRGDRLNIRVEDDGAGVNQAAVADQAQRLGFISGGMDVDSKHLGELLFRPGFSTSKTISEVSGRGIGLSVVKEAVSRLQGDVWIAPGTSGGTRVAISVPLAIATQHVVMVEANHETFAVPTVYVEAVQRRTMADVVTVDGRASIVWESEPLPLVYLSRLLEMKSGERAERGSLQILIISAADMRVAVIVDRILDDREAIVRDTGLQRAEAGFSTGAIPLDDGTAAVLLNVTEVLQAFRHSGGAATFATAEPAPRRSRILVVDDSITTRSVERSILESHGYDVELAVDGLDALDKVRSARPDLIISDVAMPRLDGFQLLERLKSAKDTASIPVILVTSLGKPEEQERGLSLGADAYIVKRRFDQRELIATVRQIL